MKLALALGHFTSVEDARRRIEQARLAEQLGYSSVWASEAYGSDAVTLLAHIQAITTTLEIGSAVMQIPARTPAMTATHLSVLGELLVRTSPDPAERHRGLSMFLLDMHSPGVTVRPIKQMNGTSHFCEVFLEDVFVPDDAILGSVGEGWTVANVSLRSERDGFGDDATSLFINPFARLLSLSTAVSSSADAETRHGVADSYIRNVIADALPASLESEPGPLSSFGASIVKLFCTDANRRLADAAASMIGPAIAADTGAWGTFAWSRMLLGVPATRIAGGTDEIQRNILAERVLGLPRDPRP